MVWERGGGGGGEVGGTFITYCFVLACTLLFTCYVIFRWGGGGILVSDNISGQDIGICIVCFGLLCSCVCVFVF